MRQKRFLYRRSGFTLIEMIGVIAIIAILAAFITPKVFKVINDSKVTRFAGEVSAYAAAVTEWYRDMGTLESLNASGVADDNTPLEGDLISNGGTTATTGLWVNWDGPYIDSVTSKSLGTTLQIYTYDGVSGTSTPGAGTVNDFDLNDDGANDMTNKTVVCIRLQGVTTSDKEKIDSILDKGLTSSTRATSGKVKYNGTYLIIYLASA